MEEAWELAALKMPKDSTEISVSKDGFGFKTDGEASERLANAALDFLSPITEGAGFLGTKLRGYRMEAALKATVRAKEICVENNLPINPVPPKFLLQWIEGASMEDIDSSDNLTEMWANLLASASSGSERNLNLFVDILKKLDPIHVQFFLLLIQNGENKFWVDAPYDSDKRSFQEYIGDACQAIKQERSIDLSNETVLEVYDDILTQYDSLAGVMITLGMCFFYDTPQRIKPPKDGSWGLSFRYDHKEFPEDVVESLLALNLIELVKVEDYAPLIPECELCVQYIYISAFGVAFVEACIADKQTTENTTSKAEK